MDNWGLLLWAIIWFFIGYTAQILLFRRWLNRMPVEEHMMVALSHLVWAKDVVRSNVPEDEIPEDWRKLEHHINGIKEALLEN